jgi:hypothetical protein
MKHDKLVAALAAGGVAYALAAAAFALTAPIRSRKPTTMAHAHVVHAHSAMRHNVMPGGAMPGGAPPEPAKPAAAEPTYYSEMAEVDARMHEGMMVAPTGDVDRDFARMMIPHHQGAIDMARVLLKYGHDERLRRLAQAIIVEQGQEIAYMHTLLDPPVAVAPPTRDNADQ